MTAKSWLVACFVALLMSCSNQASRPQTSIAAPGASSVPTQSAVAGQATSDASSARPEVPQSAISTTRDEAISALRAHASDAQPLLFPASVPAGWTVDLLIDAHGEAPDEFSLWFRDPEQRRVVQLSVRGSNTLTPSAHSRDSDPNFRGDVKSYYRVADTRDPRSDRKLVWFEPGAPLGMSGTGYSLASSGLAEDEFWRRCGLVGTDRALARADECAFLVRQF